jgi:hypothetical protein
VWRDGSFAFSRQARQGKHGKGAKGFAPYLPPAPTSWRLVSNNLCELGEKKSRPLDLSTWIGTKKKARVLSEAGFSGFVWWLLSSWTKPYLILASL